MVEAGDTPPASSSIFRKVIPLSISIRYAASLIGAALSLTTAANAVTVVGATEINITSAGPTYLQVAELQAFDFSATNVALAANGGSATGSSTYDATSTPGKAIDGNTGGGYYTDTIFHSSGASAGEFLDVTFAAANLSSVSIFGRTDCCSYRDTYNVQIFDAAHNVLFSGTVDATNAGHVGTLTFDSAVPEPATWALLIGGFAMVGMAARRRRTAIAA